ncbi:subtilisin-like protein [Colletotrichum zoysiae]|uniref:Subtilisin-like protein n=1 Tax=Colletotrichum zoysiae TaxID=1216348 RepID=A0AAD9LZJ0_9PEZI|nr:subtilisin-like protein [Colletotrichum zoysiae]
MKLNSLWLGLAPVFDSTPSRRSISTTPPRSLKPDRPIRIDPQVAYHNVNVERKADVSLKALSQPPHLASFSPADMPGYAYPASSGKGVTVYIIDTGADPEHQEYTRAPGNKRWIFIPEDAQPQKTDDLAAGHGTCVQSLVNGPRFGAAKDADVVIVKIPQPRKSSYIMDALDLVIKDITARNLKAKAVVTMSLVEYAIDIQQSRRLGRPVLKDFWKYKVFRLEKQLEQLIKLDVPVVAAAGNQGDEYEHLSTYPGKFAAKMDIVAVGGMEPNGSRWYRSEGGVDEVTALAAVRVECAVPGGGSETRYRTSTSYAAPRVAGMIATWLSSPQYGERLRSKGKVAANVKKLMRDLAYVKLPASEPGGGYPSNTPAQKTLKAACLGLEGWILLMNVKRHVICHVTTQLQTVEVYEVIVTKPFVFGTDSFECKSRLHTINLGSSDLNPC